jgi:sirohydrochlorin ferrochelatase
MERLSWLLSQSQTRTQTTLQVATIAGFQGSKSEKNISNPLVGTACLELAPVPLHEQIREFGDRALKYGYNRIEIVPLFLLPGVHVMEDIPAEVAIAQESLGHRLKLELKPHLGTHPGLIRLLAAKQATTKAEAGILLAHGSRRAGAKQPVEAIAQQLEMLSAYWAVPPSLASRVHELVTAGHEQIGIIPYFLFAGGITDAIASSVEQLQGQFPAVDIRLAEPLGASQELGLLILDLVD